LRGEIMFISTIKKTAEVIAVVAIAVKTNIEVFEKIKKLSSKKK